MIWVVDTHQRGFSSTLPKPATDGTDGINEQSSLASATDRLIN